MTVVIMNKEEKIEKICVNPKIEISCNKNRFLITVNDEIYPTPYVDDTVWNFEDEIESFILMQIDEGSWIISKQGMTFHGRDFNHN